ncbi:MAG: lyase family protein, partial [Verrucomicrobiota bacterium]|nr:lyase family protein [Verrucomicrobiota bacterium]
MWKGRFTQETADLVRQYTESISFDARLSAHDIAGSIAHASALAEAGIISLDEKERIETALRAIESDITRGEF